MFDLIIFHIYIYIYSKAPKTSKKSKSQPHHHHNPNPEDSDGSSAIGRTTTRLKTDKFSKYLGSEEDSNGTFDHHQGNTSDVDKDEKEKRLSGNTP